jgi:hypothetical protein
LQGVDPSTQYAVTDVRTGQDVGTYSGQQLADGLALALPDATSVVLSVTPIGTTSG